MPQQDLASRTEVSSNELKYTKKLIETTIETTINSLYRALPGGEGNYGDKNNSKIGYFSVRHHSDEIICVVWNLSEESRRHIHGTVSRDIAALYVDSKTYNLYTHSIPKDLTRRLVKDTESVMDRLGFAKEDKDEYDNPDSF